MLVNFEKSGLISRMFHFKDFSRTNQLFSRTSFLLGGVGRGQRHKIHTLKARITVRYFT